MDLNVCYNVLDLKPGVDEREVKRQTKRLLLKFHPDVYSHDTEYATRKTREILYAYKKLLEIVREGLEYQRPAKDRDPTHQEAVRPGKMKREYTTYLQFIFDGESLCIPAEHTREVTRLTDIPLTWLPHRAKEESMVRGIGRWREGNIPLVSAGKEKIPMDARVIVMEYNGRCVGLVVDRIDGIFTALKRASSFIDMLSMGRDPWVKRVVQREGEIIGILEIDSLI